MRFNTDKKVKLLIACRVSTITELADKLKRNRSNVSKMLSSGKVTDKFVIECELLAQSYDNTIIELMED